MSETLEALAKALVRDYADEVNPLGDETGYAAEQVQRFKGKLADFAFAINPEVRLIAVTAETTPPSLERRLHAACERVAAYAEKLAKECDLRVWYKRTDVFGKTGRATITFSHPDHIG